MTNNAMAPTTSKNASTLTRSPTSLAKSIREGTSGH
jgi:hypothetical protein